MVTLFTKSIIIKDLKVKDVNLGEFYLWNHMSYF